MQKHNLKTLEVSIAASITAYAMLGVNFAFAASPAPSIGPAPLVGAVGGPAGLIAASVAYAGYRVMKRLRVKA
ncbi:MAG: hypothetical protein WB816_14425 [Methylocystis sp.]